MLVGVDVVSVDRVVSLVQRKPRFAARVFTDAEQRDCAARVERWASTWAVKEAVRKLHAAAGAPIPAFVAIEVVRAANRAPRLRVHGEQSDVAVSISHDSGIAAAVAAVDDVTIAGRRVPVQLRLPERPDTAHKGAFGRVLVIAGSRGLTGAPVLAAMGAARGGAGLITLCVPEAIYPIVATHCIEVMPAPVPDGGSGALRPGVWEALEDQIAKADAVVIGPGLGRAPETADAVVSL